MSEQPHTHSHAAGTGGFVHAVIHAAEAFGIAAAATLGVNIPQSDTKALVISAIVAGVRGVIAYFHH